MIVEGGRLKYHWAHQWGEVIFSWLSVTAREILFPKGDRQPANLVFIFLILIPILTINPVIAQNCDVDFPGTSSQLYSAACGGSSDGLNLGKDIYFDDSDTFTFDAPAVINVHGNLTVTAQGSGTIIIPAGVTVIVDGNMQLNDQNGGCQDGNPCTFTIVVNGYLQVAGNLQNNLNRLVWEGSGTVEVQDRLENSSNACMSCGLLSCPSFQAGAGGCVDNGCILDFCLLNYGTVCLVDLEKPNIVNCPPNITVATLPGSCEAQVSWTPPKATDNCKVVSFTSSHSTKDFFPLGLSTVTYTAIDQTGNSATCSFEVNVEDQQPPEILNCPSDIAVLGIDPAEDSVVVNWSEPSALDNCALLEFTSSHQPGTKYPKGQTLVTYSATDNAGNFQTCSFTIAVSSNNAPTGKDIFVQTNSSQPVKVCLDASDPDDDAITLQDIDYDPALGLIDPIDPEMLCFVYTPALGAAGEVSLIATVCDDSSPAACLMINISINVLEEDISVYKAFSPNGDGINDLWIIERIEQYPDNSVMIFDRWGSIIYHANGYNNENIVWDGTGDSNAGGAAPAGTYYYSINLQGAGQLKGYLELIK